MIELLVAMAVMTTCSMAVLSLVVAGQAIARRQPELADQQQRARIALETLGSELALAGAGLERGPRTGPLAQYFAPIAPSADGGLTVWYVSGASAQATLADPLDPAATSAAVDTAGVCVAAQPACAFSASTSVIVFDGGGCRDVARVDDVTTTSLILHAAIRSCAYARGASIAAGEVRTYRVDGATRQLLRRDEATGISLPVLDNVSGMSVEFFDSNRRIRVTVRLVATLFQLPDFSVALDVSPSNLRERW